MTARKTARYIGIGLLALLALLVLGVAYIVLTFNPNDYKPRIVEMVKTHTGRTLTIPGDIRLRVFPRVGLQLGELSISERDSRETFASIQSARVSLELLPLLSRKLVVDEVQIAGLDATIRRDEKGALNIGDLIGGDEQEQAPEQQEQAGTETPDFDIGGIAVRDSRVLYDDRQQGRRIEISDLNLTSGALADGVPAPLELDARVKGDAPNVDARLAATTTLTLDMQAGRYVLDKFDLALDGAFVGAEDGSLRLTGNADLQPKTKRFALTELVLASSGTRDGAPFELQANAPKLAVTDTVVEGDNLVGELQLTQDARRIHANFELPSFTGSPQAVGIPALQAGARVNGADLELQASLNGTLSGNLERMLFESPQLALDLEGRQGDTPIRGSLRTPLSLDMEKGVLTLPKLVADFILPGPTEGGVALQAQGKASANLEAEAVSANLAGKLDQSPFTADLGMNGFSKPAWRFDIGIDRLDVDRYTASRKKSAPAQASQQEQAPAGKPAAGAAAEEPIDLTFLQDLDARGSVRVGQLKVAGINAAKLRVDMRAQGGTLQLNPVNANLYGGSLAGSASVQAARLPRVTLRQKLSNVNVGPLLTDALGRDMLTGRGEVQLDVAASGATTDAMLRALDGTARLALHDGVIRGINIAQVLRNARSRIDALRGKESAAEGTGDRSESTDFSEMSGSFRIEKGVARNDDLDVKSPLLRIGGTGSFDLPQRRLDYLVKATVVATLKGQGGPELEALKGVTVPVRLHGPFDALDWNVDVGAMAASLARQKLEGKAEQLGEKARKSLDGEKDKLKDNLQERLRGLLGR